VRFFRSAAAACATVTHRIRHTRERPLRLTLFGTGYVGLVTGTCFAEMGNDVLCIDVDAARIDALNRGEVPIYEPGLEAMVASNRRGDRLHFSTDTARGVAHGEILFIAVGTPADADGSADLSHVLAVARTIATHMTTPKLVVGKSTVPVGTADRVRETMTATLRSRGVDLDFHVLSNPEFLKEGAAINDFMKPDRIVIGADDVDAARQLDQLYAPFNRNHDRIIHMDVRSAELTKYAANVMLATRISLMNEFANLADRLGADIEAVRRGIGSDPRIGFNFIYPGVGYGGSCFPKDVKALIHTARSAGYEAAIVEGVEAVNRRQKTVLFDKLLRHFGGTVRGRSFAIWGLAFKPNTDDMREAPSVELIDRLLDAGATVRAYDPAARQAALTRYHENPAIQICARREETVAGADALLLVTEWNEFRSPDFGALRQALRQPVIFDGRNLYDPQQLETLGFTYYGIGRGLSDRGL
jgi:UDPglucose 6-dehydrogenase